MLRRAGGLPSPSRGAVVVAALVLSGRSRRRPSSAGRRVPSANGNLTAGSLVITNTPSGGSACTSTGATGLFTSDTESCIGSVYSSTVLSGAAGTAESLTSSFASAGTAAPASATAGITAPGVAVGRLTRPATE